MSSERKYERSHPWFTFTFDPTRFGPRLWIALGEAQSKSHHIAGVPLKPEIAKRLHIIYLARGLLATTAIEGNTLTEEEVQKLLDKKLKLPPSRQYLAQEIDNILHACNGMLSEIRSHKIVPLSRKLIEKFNEQVLHKLELEPDVVPGKVRRHSVTVGRYLGVPAEDCEYLLDRLCDWLNHDFNAPEGDEIIYALIKSIVAHVYLAWIHPFGDGNGRTARLLEVKFLLEAGVPSDAAHLLSNHYNLTRTEYYKQLDRTSKSNGDLNPFIQYAVTGFVDQLREQVQLIKEQQLGVCWVNYVHERFANDKSEAARRQRDLVIAMSAKNEFIKVGEIAKINTDIAARYATKTRKTITRDLNKLKKLGLVESGRKGYRAKVEIILAFLPVSINRPALAKRSEPLGGRQQELPIAGTSTSAAP